MLFPRSRHSALAYIFWYMYTIARVLLVDSVVAIRRSRRK